VETGPLVRVSLFRLAEDDHVLLVVMHHIICDAWTLALLTHEAGGALSRRATGDAPPLRDLSVQYADYAKWQRERLQGDLLASALDYWKQELADASTLELPTDRARPNVRSARGGRVVLELPVALGRRTRARWRAARTSRST